MSGARVVGHRCTPNRFTAEDVRAFWDSVTDEYVHADGALAEAHFQRFDRAFAHFQPHDGMRALNIWSRTGEAIDYFRRRAPRLALVNAEVSPRMIAQIAPHVDVALCADIAELELATQFDYIVCNGVLEFVPSAERCIEVLAAHLREGGRLVVVVPRRSLFGAN